MCDKTEPASQPYDYKEEHRTGYASQLGEVNQVKLDGSKLYVDSIKRVLEHRYSKLMMELQMVQEALQACTPEAEAALKLARMLEKLGMRTSV